MERTRNQTLRRSMWIKPSGYVIGALLAGALSAAGPQRFSTVALPLLVLWVILDLCAGTVARVIRVLGRSGLGRVHTRSRWHLTLQALIDRIVCTAEQHIGADTDTAQLRDAVLSRLGFELVRRTNVR